MIRLNAKEKTADGRPSRRISLQLAAICCNWLQVFHTKGTKETKRKAEVKAAATGCNWLQSQG